MDKRTRAYKELVKKADSVTIAPPIVEPTPVSHAIIASKACPWCVSQGKAGDKLTLTHRWQCNACGKLWKEEALGKPYSLELEQGLV